MRIAKLKHWKDADAGWLRDMDTICFPAPDPSFNNGPSYHWWVAYDGDRPVAYAGLYVQTKGLEAHFERCGVLPSARGQGLQRALIKARLVWCRRKGMLVAKTYTSGPQHADGANAYSIANLRDCGFQSRVVSGGKWVRFALALKGA